MIVKLVIITETKKENCAACPLYNSLYFLLSESIEEILAQFKAYQAPQPKWGMAADQQGLVQQA